MAQVTYRSERMLEGMLSAEHFEATISYRITACTNSYTKEMYHN
ncbi:hypothetical protein T09_375 [Trichinella sp. T9]|nr:hypothetical protein T09_375 [Trichinella sp. T9]